MSRYERWFGPWTTASVAIYVAFIATLSFFVGEPAWGPRYLTPAFAAVWLFAPQGAAVMRRRTPITLLAAGLAVQFSALSVETVRLYIEQQWPLERFLNDRWFYFRPLDAKLVNRPREIVDILTYRGPPAERFTPALEPTFPVTVSRKPIDVRRYQVLNSLRPWWSSQQYLAPEDRPVAIGKTVTLLLSLAALGAVLMAGSATMRDAGTKHRSANEWAPERQLFPILPAAAQTNDAEKEAGEDRLCAEHHEHHGGNDLPHGDPRVQSAQVGLLPVPSCHDEHGQACDSQG